MKNILSSLRKRMSAVFVAFVFVGIAISTASLGTAQAASNPCTGTTYTFPILQAVTSQYLLKRGDCVKASNNNTILAMQNDGNLVVYTKSFTALWASNTVGKGAIEAFMQGDGNFVLYTQSGKAVWASNTSGNTDAYLYVQNDGNVVIYTTTSKALWATHTVHS